MITLDWNAPESIEDVRKLVQGAIDLEFATLPPYLYAKLSIIPDRNPAAFERFNSVVLEEMIHMCLACNVMNAIGGTVELNSPKFPGRLPGDVAGGHEFNLLPFSKEAVNQGLIIEEPVERVEPVMLATSDDTTITIGEYYERLKTELGKLPRDAWHENRNQVTDDQFFQGQIFGVHNYDDACRAIDNIVSEGEGTPVTPNDPGSPLDFEEELAHYYRFWEIAENKVLTKNPEGGPTEQWAWGGPLGVDWDGVFPAIPNPQLHDFSSEPAAAQDAQHKCNAAYDALVDGLRDAFTGDAGGMGRAVRAMFDLRMATIAALHTPLYDGRVAGPTFVYDEERAAKAREAALRGAAA